LLIDGRDLSFQTTKGGGKAGAHYLQRTSAPIQLAVTIWTSCCRRFTNAFKARVSGSASRVGGGFITSAKCASTSASITSVLARRPLARAKLWTCRGFSKATAIFFVSSRSNAAISYPPLASKTTSSGFERSSIRIRRAIPGRSLETCARFPLGLKATSKQSRETSIPTNPERSMLTSCLTALPCVMRTRVRATVRACDPNWARRRPCLAQQRSRRTSGGIGLSPCQHHSS
jgi:hypothetical protein